MEIKWTKPSEDDLQNFLDNIHEGTEISANQYILNLMDYVNILKDNPYAGKMLMKYSDYNIRQLVYKKHKIIYSIRDKIYILAVVHSARNMRDIIKELILF